MATIELSGRWRMLPILVGALLGLQGVSRAGDCRCPCPPPYVHYQERPPKICFRCICPKPVCPPCDAEFWGYYPTCWRRWPAPFANCPERTPAWLNVPPPWMGPPNAVAGMTGTVENIPGTPAPQGSHEEMAPPPHGPGSEMTPMPMPRPEGPKASGTSRAFPSGPVSIGAAPVVQTRRNSVQLLEPPLLPVGSDNAVPMR